MEHVEIGGIKAGFWFEDDQVWKIALASHLDVLVHNQFKYYLSQTLSPVSLDPNYTHNRVVDFHPREEAKGPLGTVPMVLSCYV